MSKVNSNTTSNTTSKTNSNTQEQANEAGYVVGTTVHVAPGDLLMNRNIRDAAPDEGLVRSVKALGVLEPITAVLTDEGTLLVRYGHRRTLAAIKAGVATVPVYVSGTDHDTSDKAAEAARMIAQHDENTHRTGLTVAEEVGFVEQLTLTGLSAAQITKQARIPRARVDAAVAVSASTLARKATERYDALTLDQAAVVAEFEDDAETVKALVVAATEGSFEHAAQRARDRRADARAHDALTAALAEAGVRVIDAPSHDDNDVLPLDRIRTSSDTSTPARVSVEDHASCPGHVAWLGTTWVRVDADGEPVEFPDEPDEPDADADAETVAAAEKEWDAYEKECQRIRATSRDVQRPTARYGCSQWKSTGHTDSYASSFASGSSRPAAADMSAEEREQAKADRRTVIDNNKSWVSAETVRREFVGALAKAKTPPKGTAAFLARALCADSAQVSSVGGNALAADWLGVKHPDYGWADLSPAKSATENRALVVALVQVLGGHEASLTKDSWRHDGTHNATGRYLRFLQSAGYALSDVEKYAIIAKRV